VKRPRKIRAFNRVQPQMTEEDQQKAQFISPSKHKLNPYLMMHFTRTEQFLAGDPITPWNSQIVYANSLNTSAGFGVPSLTAVVACDTYYDIVSLLLFMNGANGSTTFTDSSPSPKTISVFGNTQISTAQSKFGGASGYFDGTGDYITVPGSSDFQMGIGNFTFEGWIKSTTTGNYNGPFGQFPNNSDNGRWDIKTRFAGTNNLVFTYYTGSSYVDIQASPAVNLNDDAWHHIAVCRSGNTIYVFSDGVQRASAAISGSQIIGLSTNTFNVGYNPTDNLYYTGYIDDIRITKGVARYTSNFTPTTETFPAVSCNTCDFYYSSVSLYLQMNGINNSTTFTDSSPSPKTVTANGNAKISTTESKFGGASGSFDGSGDYVSASYSTSAYDWWTTDYTLEFWVYANDLSSFSFSNGTNVVSVLAGNADPAGGTNYWSFGPISTGVVRFYYFTGTQRVVSSTQTIGTGSWNHIALVKNSSGINIFINGVGLASPVAIVGTPQSSATQPLVIGSINSRSINGYVDDLRITKGVARYTGNFTPPTASFPTTACP